MKHLLRLAPLLLLTLACLLFAIPSQAQRTDSLQARLDSLSLVHTALQTKLTWVELDIAEVEAELARIEFKRLSAEGIEIEIRQDARLRPSASPGGQLGTIPAGTTVKAAGYTGGYWHVHYEGQTGYVSDVFVLRTEQTRRFVEAVKQAEAASDQARPRAEPPPRNTRRSTSGCCRICRTGKACGDSCIARSKTCRKGPGCACNG